MTGPVLRRALLSLSDKNGLDSLAAALTRRGITLVSTGGTAAALRSGGHAVTDVAAVTGFPEMMDGRVKTLHPRIHGGLLAVRDNAGHERAMAEHGIPPIDLLVVSLYPFEATVAAGEDRAAIVENIDIGGPALIRAGAKNHDSVVVLVDPSDYPRLIAELEAHGGATSRAFRVEMAAKAYARTAAYDAAIAHWFAGTLGDTTPALLTISGRRRQQLRYGENAHQWAALYESSGVRFGIATARQIQGKALSYNNIADADAALELIADLDPDRPAVAIVKHANPCGAATATTLGEAYALALRTDPVSAFGGIIVVNQALDAATAERISRIFTEVIVAPDASTDAIAVLAAKPALRLLLSGGMPDRTAAGALFKPVSGGFLMQSRDNRTVEDAELTVVTRRTPTAAEMADLVFAAKVAKHVKSNAIVYVKGGATAGIGAGQMSRINSTRIAAAKAREASVAAGLPEPLTAGSVVASDAFFPFADGLVAAAEAGATAVIQPGGSVRDDEVIAAADARGLAMVFTGLRHFRH